MTTEIAIAATGCLTPSGSEAATAILRAREDREVDPATWPLVEAFAAEARPALPLATEDDLRKIVGSLAGTLKRPRMSLDQGRLQRGMYIRALQDVELFRLSLAAEHFIRTAEWMPTPGQIRTQALIYGHPVWIAHARARRFVRERIDRQHRETMRALQLRTLGQDQLDQLPDATKLAGIACADLVPTPEGSVTYPTRETLERWRVHNRALMIETRKDE